MSSFEPPKKRVFYTGDFKPPKDRLFYTGNPTEENPSNRLDLYSLSFRRLLATKVKTSDVMDAFKDMLLFGEEFFDTIIDGVYGISILQPNENAVSSSEVMRTCEGFGEMVDEAINDFANRFFQVSVAAVPGRIGETNVFKRDVLKAYKKLNRELPDLDEAVGECCGRLWEHARRTYPGRSIPNNHINAFQAAYRVALEPLGRNADPNYLPDIAFLFSYLLLLTLEMNGHILRIGEYKPVLHDVMFNQLPGYVLRKLREFFGKKEAIRARFNPFAANAFLSPLPPSFGLAPPPPPPPPPPPADPNDDLFDGPDMN